MATTAEHNGEETSAETVKNIDLGGDIYLIFGPEGCKVRVKASKALLSFASSYFRAIFAATFKEGADVEAGEDVVFSEDEPDAVVNLLKILHMQYTWPKPMAPLELVALAIVSDKYDCVKAISLGLQALFPATSTVAKASDLVNVLVASYLLDYPTGFYHSTQRLVMDHLESMADLGKLEIAQRVPASIFLTIASHRERALRCIMTALSKLSTRPCYTGFKDCARTREWNAILSYNLQKTKLDFIDGSTTTITEMLNKAESLLVPAFNASTAACGYHLAGQEGHPTPTTQHQYNMMVRDARNRCVGLCLDCVRGGKSREECRIKHT